MSDAFLFEALSTTLRATNLNKILEGSAVNLCRNGSFEFWDSSTEPYGWDFDDGGSDTLASSTNLNYVYDGAKCARVTKDVTGTAHLKRSIAEVATVFAKSKYWSACAKVKGDYDDSSVRLWISFDGGSTKTYSSYAAGGASHNALSVRAECGAAPSNKPMVGIEMAAGSYDCYIDAVGFFRGEIAWPWTECIWDPSGNITDDLDPLMPHVWVWDPYGATINLVANAGTSSAWTSKDVPVTVGTWCYDNAKAILCRAVVGDANYRPSWDGSPADAFMKFRTKGDTDASNEIIVRPLAGGSGANGDNPTHSHSQIVVIGLDTGGEFEYWIQSGNGTNGFYADLFPLAHLRPI